MTELHEAALRAGVWDVVEKRAKELGAEARQDLLALEVGDTVAGRHDGVTVAKATKTAGRLRVVITDEDGFTRWVASRWPTEVVVQQVVNTAFLEVLKKDAATKGAVIDADGEVCPYVEVVEGSPYITIRKDKDAPFLVAQLLSSGALSLDGVKEIEQ